MDSSDAPNDRQPFALDLYCGRGGVGRTLDDLGLQYLGVDIEPYGDTYPGEFVRGDASRPPIDPATKIDLLWLSPPCLYYSKLTKSRYDDDERAERYPTFSDLRVREVIRDLKPENHIIENVVTCEDIREPTKLNGRAFNLPFCQERWFETSFPVPDCKENPQGAGDCSEVPIGGCRNRDDQQGRKKRLADAKGVPADWEESRIIAAIPSQYVQYLLHYCPSTPNVPLPNEQTSKQTTLTGVAD